MIGGLLRAASEYHAASHPDVISHASLIQAGTYEGIRRLCAHFMPDQEPLPDYEPLGDDYLFDLAALLRYDQARQEKVVKDAGKGKYGRR